MKTNKMKAGWMAMAATVVILTAQTGRAEAWSRGSPRGCVLRDIQEQVERCLTGYREDKIEGWRDCSPISLKSVRVGKLGGSYR